ncbi:MAG: aldose 1-epimerase family protein, partial [Rhizobiaceae bacterium]|nr:aldose 1-epimerase family protein [Rhizobiaceae bacterium]
MSERHRIGGSGLSAEVAVEGAELVSLRDASGDELLWQAGPEWPRHAPVLFPIVGRLAADTLRHDGQEYALTQHGFARDSTFRVTEESDDRIVLRLDDSASSRARFPFPFRLEMIYEADGETLTV